MARQKHFRLPDDVLEMINNRDKEIYPTENIYHRICTELF